MSVLTDLIYGGSNAVAGLTEGAVNDAIAKYGEDKKVAMPDTAYFLPTIYAATGVKVSKLGDLPACVGVLKSLISNKEDLGEALNAGLATAVGAEIIEALILIHKPGHRPVRNPFVQLLRHRASVIVIHVGHGKAFISGIIPLACKFFRIKPQRVPGMMQELLR